MSSPFRRRTTVWLVVVCSVSFAAALALAVLGPDLGAVPSAESDSYSRSALGHHAFLAMLQELDVPVVRSRYDSGRRAAGNALLVIAEPLLRKHGAAELKEMARAAGRVLLVLPKWKGIEDPERPGWIRAADLRPVRDAQAVLDVFDKRAQVVRPRAEAPTGWTGGTATLVAPQLVTGASGIVTCDGGALVARFPQRWGFLYVLADPDVIANHGLGRPGNAPLAAALIERARGDRDAVVIDETAHGHVSEPSVFRALFAWPVLCATLAALLAAAVLAWAAVERFGAPHPEPPRIEPGKGFLIDNTASLLRFGGQSAHALGAYLESAVRVVRERLHLPADLDREALAARLDARAPDAGERLRALARAAVRSSRPEWVLRVARGIHAWKREMIDGPGRDS